jgi:hypothetical protein
LSAVSSSDGGITWTATFTPTAITDATNLITLDNTGQDARATPAAAPPTPTTTPSTPSVRPRPSWWRTTTSASATSLVTITFSEAVTGFTNADLTIANGTLSA